MFQKKPRPQIINTYYLEPGDLVLVQVEGRLDREALERLRSKIQETFENDDLRVVVFDDRTTFKVIRKQFIEDPVEEQVERPTTTRSAHGNPVRLDPRDPRGS
jgi:hypothetical protein